MAILTKEEACWLENFIVRFLQAFAKNKDDSYSPGELNSNSEGPGLILKAMGENDWIANHYLSSPRTRALRDADWRREAIRAACERLVRAKRIGVDHCCLSPRRPNGDGVRGYWAGPDEEEKLR